MIQVYTGNGKGKTTAALGLALRTLGHGKNVLLIQFMKQDQACGEIQAAGCFDKFKILQFGCQGWVKKDKPGIKDKQFAQQGLEAAQEAIKAGKHDLIILDELNVACEFGLIKVEQISNILKGVPKSLELVITGRYLDPVILELADLVSEIKEVKHYFKKGIKARAGIEY